MQSPDAAVLATPAAARRSIVRYVAGGAAIGIVLGSAILLWRQGETGNPAGPMAADIQRRLTLLEARVLGTGASSPEWDRRLDALEDRLGRLAARQLAAEHRRSGEPGDVRAADRIAVAALYVAVAAASARPFERELQLLRRLVEGRPRFERAVADLLIYAARGAPALADLRERFATVKPLVVARAETEARTWSQRLGDGLWWLLAQLEFVEPPPPAKAVTALAQVEALLVNGQLAAAVSEIQALEPALQSVASGWIVQARMRLNVDLALADLMSVALDD